MNYVLINAYQCTCEKCGYVWSSIKLPATCANKQCRTPRWNTQAAKKSNLIEMQDVYVPTPTVQPSEGTRSIPQLETNLHPERSEAEKLATINSLKSLADKDNYRKDKSSDYYTKPHSALPQYRPQEWEEPTIS